jgi:hypothetical protein
LTKRKARTAGAPQTVDVCVEAVAGTRPDPKMRMSSMVWLRLTACVIAASGLAGCAELLPKEHNEIESPWPGFGEARTAIERIEPFKTTRAELNTAGIDPYATPNVVLLTYSDIILRFPIGGSVPPERLDRGLRECLYAGKACYGYAMNLKDVKRDRTGNFWLDSLQFHRKTDVSGWTFNALILLVDDVVVYTLYGGQPIIREQVINRQPLGPLQGWGDMLPGLVR